MIHKKLAVGFVLIVALSVIGMFYAATSPRRHLPPESSNRSGAILGRVLDSSGQPVVKAQVTAVKTDFQKGVLPATSTDEEGKFFIEHLTPGIYEIRVEKDADGYPSTGSAFHSVGVVPAPQVSVMGQQSPTNVVVNLGPKAAILVGRIVDALTNSPIQDARMTLQRADNPDNFYLTGPNQGEATGEFRILIPPAPVTIKVSAPGYKDWYYKGDESKNQSDALQVQPEATKRLMIRLQPVK